VTAREFFEALPARANGSGRADGIDASYVFEIRGSGTWTVVVREGHVTVSEGEGNGDCRISTSEETFDRLVAGKQNPLTAYMTGKLKVHGDTGAALKLKHLFQ
jgi:putative sterol carrier protein